MKTEYLITFDTKDDLCVDVERFKHLLLAHTSITIGPKSTIKFGGDDYHFVLATGKLPDGSVYYDLTVECSDDKLLLKYIELLREIRKICAKSSGRNIIVLYDGAGEKYCQLGYPIVYKTENMMRKLISKFMAISIGIDWADTSVPREVIDSVRVEGKRERSSFLFDVDFIQLSNFLFKKYTKNDGNKFFDSIKGMDDEASIKVSELKQYVPVTNWEKYFAKKVQCDSEYLKSKWERLYDYRCKIAHCRALTLTEYEELTTISQDVCEKIESALVSIGDLHISADEREDLAENISGAANDRVAEFIASYNQLSTILQAICTLVSGNNDVYAKHATNKTNIRMQSKYLCNNKGLIDYTMVKAIENAQNFRNKVVHKFGLTEVSESEVMENIVTIESILNEVLRHDSEDFAKYKDIDLKKNGEEKQIIEQSHE